MATINQIGDSLDKEKQPFSLESTNGVLPSHPGREGRRSATTYFKSTQVFKTRLEVQDNEHLRTKTKLCIGLVFDLIQIETLSRIRFDKAASLPSKENLSVLLSFTICKHCSQLPTCWKTSAIDISFDL